MASDFGHPGAGGGSSARIATPFGASSPELRATLGENSGLKIPVSGIQFSPVHHFFSAVISSWQRSC
jgi:hypothetical protein